MNDALTAEQLLALETVLDLRPLPRDEQTVILGALLAELRGETEQATGVVP